MMDPLLKRKMALDIAWRLYGTPYRWGGDDPMKGYDCSGLIIEVLQSVGILPRAGDWTAGTLWDHFHALRVEVPCDGCLVFWGTRDGGTRPIHVELCLNDELAIGASGGGSQVKTEQDAVDANAFVKVRPFRSRAYLIGFVDPFRIEGAGGVV